MSLLSLHPADRWARVARWAEGVYAAVALLFAMALPPPSGRTVTDWVHWLGTAALAAMTAWRLDRTNVARLVAAAALCVYVLAGAALGLGRLARLTQLRAGGAGAPTALALAMAAVVWASQLTVAYCLYRIVRARRGNA